MLKLGYLAFAVRRPARWNAFCRTMLGLPEPVTNLDGSLGYALDGEVRQRLIVEEGKADDLAALGPRLRRRRRPRCPARPAVGAGPRHGARAAPRSATRAGSRACICSAIPWATASNCTAAPRRPTNPSPRPRCRAASHRRPRHGPRRAGEPRSWRHGALLCRRIGLRRQRAAGPRSGPIQVRGTFLHCNRRHHSMALFDLPLRKRLHHFMLQAARLADIGMAFERAQRTRVPLSLELGQHPDPDGTFSFYGRTPSGFDFEIGAGTQEIDPAGWHERIDRRHQRVGPQAQARPAASHGEGTRGARVGGLTPPSAYAPSQALRRTLPRKVGRHGRRQCASLPACASRSSAPATRS